MARTPVTYTAQQLRNAQRGFDDADVIEIIGARTLPEEAPVSPADTSARTAESTAPTAAPPPSTAASSANLNNTSGAENPDGTPAPQAHADLASLDPALEAPVSPLNLEATPPEFERMPPWLKREAGFDSFDGTRLFYRYWQPNRARGDGAPRGLLLLHGPGEHSARLDAVVEQLGYEFDWAFACDARGHGHSPGERGDASHIDVLVRDLHHFARHIRKVHGVARDNLLVLAPSLSALVALAWVHDYAPPVRGVVLVAPVLGVQTRKLPQLSPVALRWVLRFAPEQGVRWRRPVAELTHATEQAKALTEDPLCFDHWSARLLSSCRDAATRLVGNAAALDLPVLLLTAGQDTVADPVSQQRFIDTLYSRTKALVQVAGGGHALWHETPEVQQTWITEARRFIDECFGYAPLQPERHHDADQYSPSATRWRVLSQHPHSPERLQRWREDWARRGLLHWGERSEGLRLGLTYGFEHGLAVEHLCRNQARGQGRLGRWLDRRWLDSLHGRSLRRRRLQLQQMLSDLIAMHPANKPLRIVDLASGSGRYLLDAVKRFQDREIHVTLRDRSPEVLALAAQWVEQLQLGDRIELQCRDALVVESYPADEMPYDIVVIAGLFELYPDNIPVMRTLRHLQRQLKPGSLLVYTGQSWHPQHTWLARTLRNAQGEPWVLRLRSQAEIDALIADIGCRKSRTLVGLQGMSTVSVARYWPPGMPGRLD